MPLMLSPSATHPTYGTCWLGCTSLTMGARVEGAPSRTVELPDGLAAVGTGHVVEHPVGQPRIGDAGQGGGDFAQVELHGGAHPARCGLHSTLRAASLALYPKR